MPLLLASIVEINSSFPVQEVGFQIDYTLPRKGLEFGTVFLGDKNVACWVVAQGWAKVWT